VAGREEQTHTRSVDARTIRRRGTELCYAVTEGHDVLPDVLEMLACCVGTDLVSLSTLHATDSSLDLTGTTTATLTLHGCPPLTQQALEDWDRLLPTHPYAAHLATSPSPRARLTDLVDVHAFRHSEVYEVCLAPHGALYQSGHVLDRRPARLTLLSLWRADRDFTPDEVESVEVFAQALAASLLARERLAALRRLGGPDEAAGFTPRQHQVAVLVSLGLTNDQIARRLGLTTRTVRKHVELLFARTGVRSRTELAVLWRQTTRSGTPVTPVQ
jgi:DNA-binding CsgD family transcriptional regulator